MNEIERILSDWIFWLRVRRAFHWVLNGAAGGLAFSAGAALSAMLNARLLQQELLWLAAPAALAGMLLAALTAFFWPMPTLSAARLCEQALGLQERISTALELSAARQMNAAAEIIRRQYEDALSAARRANPRRGLPLKVQRWQAAFIALWLGLLALGWFGGGRYFQTALQKRLMQQAIAAEINAIQALEKQVESDERLSAEQKQALLQPLDEAMQKLQSAESVEQAMAILATAEEELQALQTLNDSQAQSMTAGLQQAGESLSNQAGSPLQSFGEKLAAGNYAAAAQELLAIDPAQLSAAEAEALADQLEQAAEALQASNPQLAENLRQAASALRSGDTAAAQQALQQAAQTLTQTSQQIAQAQTLRQATGQLGQCQKVIAQTGQNSAGNIIRTGMAASNQSASGSGQTAGQGEGNSGAGRGEGSGQAAPGTEAGNSPIQSGNGPGDGGQRDYEQIFTPQRLGGSSGENVTLPGSSDPNGATVGQSNTNSNDSGASSIPYVTVFPIYAEAYRQAIENGQVPVYLRDLVKQYFTNLQP